MHALQTRTVIAQAQGILMQRFDIASAAPLGLLRRLSMNTDTPVGDLAASIVETRDLPTGGPTAQEP